MCIQFGSNHFTSDPDQLQSTLNTASNQSTLQGELAGQIHINPFNKWCHLLYDVARYIRANARASWWVGVQSLRKH